MTFLSRSNNVELSHYVLILFYYHLYFRTPHPSIFSSSNYLEQYKLEKSVTTLIRRPFCPNKSVENPLEFFYFFNFWRSYVSKPRNTVKEQVVLLQRPALFAWISKGTHFFCTVAIVSFYHKCYSIFSSWC